MEIQKQEVILKIEDLTKSFGKTEVLKGISMEVHKNEIISVLGPSGCGKSTLLNIIAGMLVPDGGRVTMNGQMISEAGKVLPPEKRHMNMVFQDFALWPHMTAYDNIAYGLKRSKTGKEEIEERVQELLKLLHLEGLEKRYPAELSGGQWQKLSIARAFYSDADILILDEPTASLDPLAEQEVFRQFDELREGKTTVFVSHRLSSATLASKIVVLENGRVTEEGTHRELMEKNGIYALLFRTQAERYLENAGNGREEMQ